MMTVRCFTHMHAGKFKRRCLDAGALELSSADELRFKLDEVSVGKQSSSVA